MKKDTKVLCDVESCRYNQACKCSLDELKVSCSCDGCDCGNKKETLCKSFEILDE